MTIEMQPVRAIRLEIPGKPFAKQRPRFSRRSGRAYTPEETVSFERQVGLLASSMFNAPLEGPVRLTVRAYFKIPASWSKKKAAAHLAQPHIQKPDADNLAKGICDGLNRIAYRDDAQVFSQRCEKRWCAEGEEERTEVIIESYA